MSRLTKIKDILKRCEIEIVLKENNQSADNIQIEEDIVDDVLDILEYESDRASSKKIYESIKMGIILIWAYFISLLFWKNILYIKNIFFIVFCVFNYIIIVQLYLKSAKQFEKARQRKFLLRAAEKEITSL